MINTEGEKEAVLLRQLKAGDPAALRALFDQYYGFLLAETNRIIGDADSSKDVVQDVFVEVWDKRAGLEIHTGIGPYLRKAAVNKALNFIRKQQKIALGEWQETGSWPDDADGYQKVEDMEGLVRAAIGQLPDKCRQVFVLSRYEQMSHKEIAEALGISTKTIENQITKAMKLLRIYLREAGKMSPVVFLPIIILLFM